MKKHSKRQIEEAICKWSCYLLEKKLATEHEVENMLGEGLFKRAKTFVKNAFKHVGQGIASGVGTVARKVHDTFAANAGVKEMMQAIKKLLKQGKDADKIKLWLVVDKKQKPIVGFKLSKNKSTLALLFDDKAKDTMTYEDLEEFLSKAGITGDDRKISDFVDALICGQVEDDEIKLVAESVVSNEADRIGKVLNAMGWTSTNMALKTNNINNLLALFGIKDTPKDRKEVKKIILAYCNAISNASDDNDNDKETEKTDQNNKSSSQSSDEQAKPDDKPAHTEEPSKDTQKQSLNTCAMKTKDGEVPVMDNPFKNVLTQGNAIGIVFGMSKADAEKKKRQQAAVET